MESIEIRTPVDASTAATLAARRARSVGFDRVRAAEIGIVASELASNIARHARSGRIRISIAPDALTLFAEDEGEIGVDLTTALANEGLRGSLVDVDGQRKQSLGCGLAAVRRLADAFDWHARPQGGLSITAILRMHRTTPR